MTTAALQRSLAGVGHRARAHLAPGQLAAGHAGQQRSPPLAVEDAHHPPAGGRLPQQGDQAGRVEARSRGLVASVDHLHDRPAGPLLGPGRGQQLRPRDRQRLQRRVGRGENARHPRPPGPLHGHVAGVPRRGPLLLVGLVALVEDEHGPQPGPRRPRPRPGADGHAPPGRGQGPVPGQLRHPHALPPQPGGQEAGGRQRRGQHQGVLPAARLQGEGEEVVGRRRAHDGHSPAERLPGQGPRRCPDRRRRLRTGGQSPHRNRGRGRLQECRPPARPAPGGPVGELDQVGRRPPPRHLGQRLQGTARLEGGGRGLVRQPHHPPADAPPGQRHPHHRPHPDVGLQRRRDQVVEHLGDARHVGRHPGDHPAEANAPVPRRPPGARRGITG